MSGKGYGAWPTAGFDMWMLGAEAASVMALRTARIAAGGIAEAAEAELMVTEKVRAAIEPQARLVRLLDLLPQTRLIETDAGGVSISRDRPSDRMGEAAGTEADIAACPASFA